MSLAEALLGAYDPLVGALRRHAVGRAQLSATAAALVASAGLVAITGAAALELLLASGVVTVVLGLRLALRRLDLRDAALDVIVAGRGDVEVPVVRRECERLLDDGRRARLAQNLVSLGDEPDMSGQVACRACVMVEPSVIAEVHGELAAVAALLRGPAPAVRGVAAAHRLLIAGGSPLYGRDPEMLREELHRVSFLLRTDS